MEKYLIRKKINNLKKVLDTAEKISAAEEVFQRLESNAAFVLAERILMYHSLPDELSTHAFLRKWKSVKQFYLPRVNGVDLDILPYDESRLELGSFHIEEPSGNDTVNPEEIELVIVPAVAYDRKGNRVGRGKGFYDRFLKNTKALKIGVGYDFQLVDEVDSEEHDVAVDIVITQSSTIIVKNG